MGKGQAHQDSFNEEGLEGGGIKDGVRRGPCKAIPSAAEGNLATWQKAKFFNVF